MATGLSTVPPGEQRTQELTREQAEAEAARHRRNVWVPRETIRSAVLRGGFVTDSLRLGLVDGRTVGFFWTRHAGAYVAIEEALRSWVGPALRLRGRQRPREARRSSPAPRAVVIRAIVAFGVVIALTLGWFDPLLDRFLGTEGRGCEEVAEITAGRHAGPDPPFAVHPAAAQASAPAVDRALRTLLLDEVSQGTFVHTHEESVGLLGHAESQHDPAARQVALEHGFVRQVGRQWTDEDGDVIRHTVVLLSSPANAASFNVARARYSCRFAEDAWSHPLDGADQPGIGQRILHRDGVVVDQVSWTRDGRRHLVEVFDAQGRPDRDLLGRLVRRAYPLDRGEDVLPG